ncbi:archease [archaeon]|jgi:SHS2 domain-containing protein|nr:archease [archaeon]MBT4373927.1 archease [archaeon]MBT4532320.1 archease [archaeon]MBT7001906.1 archease [archaeon]MBT7282081.1 archease [archaeon]
MKNIKFLAHTADVKFQAEGATLEASFSNCVVALRQSIAAEIKVKEVIEKKIEVSGKDLENLLYEFLEEFIYLLDAESFLVATIKEIKIDKKQMTLTARVLGDKAENYEFSNPVKAVTYSEMFIKFDEEKNKFICQVVLDV